MELLSLAKNPVPAGAIVGTFPGYDGAPLRFARWSATRTPRRGTICLFGGRGEFIEKYFEVIADLRRRGFAVATMDWRGQGASHRTLANKAKGYIGDFGEYDRDLYRFMKGIVLPDCPPPYVALAHSMGANVLMRNATMTGSWFDRMVLTTPMLAIEPRRLQFPLPLVRTYAEVGCLLGMSSFYVKSGSDAPVETGPFEDNLLTSDAERYLRNRSVLEAAPHLGLGGVAILIGYLLAPRTRATAHA
jgi:lysophospholipase